jgi:beta-glucosidase
MVLLKNDGVLPLDKNLGTIAVIGPNAADVDLLLGNYNGVPSNPVTPLQGIRRAVGSGTTVLYSRGGDLAENSPSIERVPSDVLFTEHDGRRVNGLKGEYFDNHEFEGTPVVTRIDPALDFTWWDTVPVLGIPVDSFSARWTGTLVPPVSGQYALGVRVFGGTGLYLDGENLFEYSDRHVVMTRWKYVELEAGVPHEIRVDYFDRRADAIVQLVWSPPNPRLRDEALEAARQADAVVMMMGLSPRLEGEEMPVNVPGFAGGDRLDMKLPAPQEELLREITALGKPVVLVLLNGSALAVNWAAENVPAIVEAWYPGQAAGTAIADVLFGDYNPAGRLPVTFYRSIEQLPPFSDYNMNGKTYRYFDGEPLFPFGHGLSYTTFAYSNLVLPDEVRAGDDVQVTALVTNTGSRVGEEVVQLYASILETSDPVPIREVSFTLSARSLSHIDSQNRRVVEPGTIEVSVGGKQPGFAGTADTSTSGVVSGRFRITGRVAVVGAR